MTLQVVQHGACPSAFSVYESRVILTDTVILIAGRGGRVVECWLGLATGRSRLGSNLTAENFSLRNFGNSVYPALPVSFGRTLKAVGPFYLVSIMSGEVNKPTSLHWNV